MEKTNFENLQIYKLSEKLSDQVWKIVGRWDNLARDTVGDKQVNDLLPLVKELTPKLNAYLRSIGSLEKKRRSLNHQHKQS